MKIKMGINVVGWLLIFLSIFSSYGMLWLPINDIGRMILALIVLITFIIAGKDILTIKVYARKFVINYLVPYLALLMSFFLWIRVKIDSVSFYASTEHHLDRPTSMDVVSPVFGFGIIICGISIISGLFILFILTRTNIKEQFK
jgi:hypothetical protein